MTTRGIQIALGLVWLLDGLFQFKSFMFTHASISEVFAPAAEKQWSIVGGPMKTFDNFYGRDLTLWNTLSGEIQIAIGLGLILSRKTVKPALLVSFGWALVVWWFGEGFGGLTSNTLPLAADGCAGGGDPLRDHRPARLAHEQARRGAPRRTWGRSVTAAACTPGRGCGRSRPACGW